jgi:hypothetical protein
MTALLDLDANVALGHAVALAQEAAAAFAELQVDAVLPFGLGEELVRLRGIQRQLDAATSALSERFAGSHEWEADGARNAPGWLSARSNDTWSSARSVVERGEVVGNFPLLARAWRDGDVSAAHVDALLRIQRRYPTLVDDLLAVDEAITTAARLCDPKAFYQRLRYLCHRVNPEAVNDREKNPGARLHVSMLLDGLVRVDGTLDAVVGARFMAALESARRDVIEDETASQGRSRSERNLDALSRILDAAGAATGDLALPLVSGERPTVNVTVPLEALIDPASAEVGWLERFGVPTTMLTGDHARQLACDASLRPLIVDRDGNLVAMAPKARPIHSALRRAVFIRDQHCRFTGCRSRIDEVHHIVFHSHGGPTVMSNLVGLCWFHHHLIHDSGWHIEGDPGGRLTFRSPQRRALSSDPPVF